MLRQKLVVEVEAEEEGVQEEEEAVVAEEVEVEEDLEVEAKGVVVVISVFHVWMNVFYWRIKSDNEDIMKINTYKTTHNECLVSKAEMRIKILNALL